VYGVHQSRGYLHDADPLNKDVLQSSLTVEAQHHGSARSQAHEASVKSMTNEGHLPIVTLYTKHRDHTQQSPSTAYLSSCQCILVRWTCLQAKGRHQMISNRLSGRNITEITEYTSGNGTCRKTRSQLQARALNAPFNCHILSGHASEARTRHRSHFSDCRTAASVTTTTRKRSRHDDAPTMRTITGTTSPTPSPRPTSELECPTKQDSRISLIQVSRKRSALYTPRPRHPVTDTGPHISRRQALDRYHLR